MRLLKACLLSLLLLLVCLLLLWLFFLEFVFSGILLPSFKIKCIYSTYDLNCVKLKRTRSERTCYEGACDQLFEELHMLSINFVLLALLIFLAHILLRHFLRRRFHFLLLFLFLFFFFYFIIPVELWGHHIGEIFAYVDIQSGHRWSHCNFR